jgi:hypothetical protein
MTGKIKVLVGCQKDFCAAEVSYFLDQVRLWKGEPVCESCWDDTDCWEVEFDDDGEPTKEKPRWSDLPPVTLADLCE